MNSAAGSGCQLPDRENAYAYTHFSSYLPLLSAAVLRCECAELVRADEKAEGELYVCGAYARGLEAMRAESLGSGLPLQSWLWWTSGS